MASNIRLISGITANDFLICNKSRALREPQITFPHSLSKS